MGVIDVGAGVFEGFMSTFGRKIPTTELEAAAGVLRRDITSLQKPKGFGQAVARDLRTAAKTGGMTIDPGVYKALNKGNLDAAQDLASGNAADALNAAQEKMAARLNDLENISKKQGPDAVGMGAKNYYKNSGDLDTNVGKAEYYTKAAGAYFTEPGKRAARIGAAAGAYAGANLGVRALTGGTATRNSSGERDIAGIPFI